MSLPIVVKAELRKDIRRFTCSRTILLPELRNILAAAYKISPPDSFRICYKDEEGENITISMDMELVEAKRNLTDPNSILRLKLKKVPSRAVEASKSPNAKAEADETDTVFLLVPQEPLPAAEKSDEPQPEILPSSVQQDAEMPPARDSLPPSATGENLAEEHPSVSSSGPFPQDATQDSSRDGVFFDEHTSNYLMGLASSLDEPLRSPVMNCLQSLRVANVPEFCDRAVALFSDSNVVQALSQRHQDIRIDLGKALSTRQNPGVRGEQVHHHGRHHYSGPRARFFGRWGRWDQGGCTRPGRSGDMPAPQQQGHWVCDACDGRGDQLEGSRWKCSVCADYDQCSSCYAFAPHEHPMNELPNQHVKGRNVFRNVFQNVRRAVVETMSNQFEEGRRLFNSVNFNSTNKVSDAAEVSPSSAAPQPSACSTVSAETPVLSLANDDDSTMIPIVRIAVASAADPIVLVPATIEPAMAPPSISIASSAVAAEPEWDMASQASTTSNVSSQLEEIKAKIFANMQANMQAYMQDQLNTATRAFHQAVSGYTSSPAESTGYATSVDPGSIIDRMNEELFEIMKDAAEKEDQQACAEESHHQAASAASVSQEDCCGISMVAADEADDTVDSAVLVFTDSPQQEQEQTPEKCFNTRHKAELDVILGMGFEATDHLIELLEKYNGGVQQVIEDLMSASSA